MKIIERAEAMLEAGDLDPEVVSELISTLRAVMPNYRVLTTIEEGLH